MTYPHSNQDQYASRGYSGYWPQSTGVANQRTSPGSQLLWAVLLLGLTTYAVSYAAVPQSGSSEWGVRFSVCAAVIAGLGLFPRQNVHTNWVVTLAVMGFLESLPRWITGDQNPRWAATVIVAATALQAVTAITALLARPRESGAVDCEAGLYDAYANYAQATRQYYAASAQQLQQQQPAQAQATPQTRATAPARAARAQQSTAERYALYEECFGAQSPQPNPAAYSPQPGGHAQSAQPAAGRGIPTRGPAEGIRPGNAPAPGTTNQSWQS